jgi:hypothetical protein
MADLLIKSGTISAVQWTETLSAEIGVTAVAGKPDDTDTYFAAVLTSLERLLVAEQNVSAMDLARRRDEWRLAYASTPHGHPVELNRGNSPRQCHDCLFVNRRSGSTPILAFVSKTVNVNNRINASRRNSSKEGQS